MAFLQRHPKTCPYKYRIFASHAAQSIYELSQVWKEGYRLSPVWKGGRWADRLETCPYRKETLFLFGNKAKHDFTYPASRYRTFAAHASQSIYELSQVWKEGYRLSPVWMRGRWADRFVHQLKLSIVENLSLQKRDTIVFNLPVNTVYRRYGDNTVWMILMCV